MKDIFKNFWYRQKLKDKFLLIIIPSSLFSSILIMILAYSIFQGYEEKLYEVARQNLYLVAGNIEKELREAEEFGYIMIADEKVQIALESGQADSESKQTSMDYILRTQQLYKVLQNGLIQNSHMISISVFSEDEWYYVGNTNRSYDRTLLNQVQFDTAQDQRHMLWCAPEYPANSLYGICYIKDLYHSTFRNKAVLVLEFDLKGSLNDLRMKLSESSLMQEFAIYNGEEVIYSDVSFASGGAWEKDTDYEIVSTDAGSYFASYLNKSDYGWKYVFFVPYGDLFGAMELMKYLFIGIASLTVIFSIIYCQKLTRSITGRFTWLLGRMESVQQGRFSVEGSVDLITKDEIDMLCQRFESMVAALNKLIQDNYIKQMLIKENQLKMLQNQLNPHFLFNTLQTINWKAKENKQREISEITESLGKLLRYTLETDEDPVLLAREKGILESYTYIQQMRYKDRLTVHIDIPEKMEQKLIPRLSLQNIVENSIKYALENMLEPCVISVKAEEVESGYQILVEDNGPGIQEGIEQVQEDFKENSGLGIGLRNIQRRLHLLFPAGSGLKLVNTGHGTLAVILIRESV